MRPETAAQVETLLALAEQVRLDTDALARRLSPVLRDQREARLLVTLNAIANTADMVAEALALDQSAPTSAPAGVAVVERASPSAGSPPPNDGGRGAASAARVAAQSMLDDYRTLPNRHGALALDGEAWLGPASTFE